MCEVCVCVCVCERERERERDGMLWWEERNEFVVGLNGSCTRGQLTNQMVGPKGH